MTDEQADLKNGGVRVYQEVGNDLCEMRLSQWWRVKKSHYPTRAGDRHYASIVRMRPEFDYCKCGARREYETGRWFTLRPFTDDEMAAMPKLERRAADLFSTLFGPRSITGRRR
jgi:hypothetical protein